MAGILEIVTAWSVSNTAQITCNASFLAPCGVMEPCRRWPPIIWNEDIDSCFFERILM